MRLAFVIQRYGLDVHGGSEYLCRTWAERLATRHHVEVLTTCARDYLTWEDHYAPGVELINGVKVQRYRVDAPRDLAVFNALSACIYDQPHTPEQEIEWMRQQGPHSSALFQAIDVQQNDFDLFIFMTYLYCTTFFGLPLVQHKAVLVPTAHDEPPIYLGIFKQVFAAPRHIIYLTPAEAALLRKLFAIDAIPRSEVGIGVDLVPPEAMWPERRTPYLLYVGRVHTSKGCEVLYDYVVRYKSERPGRLRLVFAGRADITLPQHPAVYHLGFVSEAEKQRLIGESSVVVVPSPVESLSIICLEAWASARPTLVNGHCTVLREQVVRSNGGLFYTSYEEFGACLDLLLADQNLRTQLGEQGRAFVAGWYNWPVVEQRLEAALQQALLAVAG